MEVLNKREMQMARELAQKITINNNLDDEEVLEVARDFVRNLKRVVTDVWNHIKKIVNDVANIIYETDIEKEYAYNWHVPLKIEAPPMPDIKLPCLANARSNI